MTKITVLGGSGFLGSHLCDLLFQKKFQVIIYDKKKSKYLNIKCLSVHIGSQITNHVPYLKMLKALQNVIDKSKFYFEYI